MIDSIIKFCYIFGFLALIILICVFMQAGFDSLRKEKK